MFEFFKLVISRLVFEVIRELFIEEIGKIKVRLKDILFYFV